MASCIISPLFYLVPVNTSVFQALAITPGSVQLQDDYCRGLHWPDSGLLSQTAALLPEALYCVSLNVLIVTLYSKHLLYCTSL